MVASRAAMGSPHPLQRTVGCPPCAQPLCQILSGTPPFPVHWSPHCVRATNNGHNLFPFAVARYSKRGGRCENGERRMIRAVSIADRRNQRERDDIPFSL